MVFFLILIGIPLLEIIAFVNLSDEIGVWNSIFLSLLTAFVGLVIVKIQGLGALDAFRNAILDGKDPLLEILDGLCLLIAGALLFFPGFITDIAGAMLLIPPLRKMFMALLMRRVALKNPQSTIIEAEYTRVEIDDPQIPRAAPQDPEDERRN
ncbi:MAG: FxsA family protein [Alphaproteobacteria bacterium]